MKQNNYISPLQLIELERERQDMLKADGKFQHTCADDIPDGVALAILTEEVGEVAKCLNEQSSSSDLKKELIQVAACAVAWVEKIDRYNLFLDQEKNNEAK